jgi:hypothetical protein
MDLSITHMLWSCVTLGLFNSVSFRGVWWLSSLLQNRMQKLRKKLGESDEYAMLVQK